MNQPTYPIPAFAIQVNGESITDTIQQRLEVLVLTDNRGLEADTLEITLDDSDGRLALPKRGASVALSLGWQATGLIDKGLYTVDEVEHAGAPDKLTIRARSADLRAGLAEKKETSFHAKTVGDIINHIAENNGLTAIIGPGLADQTLDHIDQTNESDTNFLTRLGEQFDAIATVKGGKLLFFRAGDAVTATGQALPEALIVRSIGDSHRFNLSDRDNYTEAEASYEDKKLAKRGSVIVEGGTKGDTAPSVPSKKTLRHTYANKSNAERAAKSAMAKTARASAEFSINLALARPDLFPEIPATVQGFKAEIDSVKWIITKATHTLSADGGFTTVLELELKL
jgi:phage protein D